MLSGCMTVIGYYPTDAELAALRRGEDPRSKEYQQRQSAGGEAEPNVSDTGAPVEGVILRWVDSATVTIEAKGRREIVAIPSRSRLTDPQDEQNALDRNMDHWTFGKRVYLSYPLRDARGQVVHRDAQGRLLAEID
jgi:hypothetical protein